MMTDKKEEKMKELLDRSELMKIENEQILQDKPVSSNREVYWVVLGEIGSGKSTLINNLIRHSLKANSITINDVNITLVDKPGFGDTYP